MLATRNGPHRSTKSEPASAEYPSSIHSPPKTVSNPMYAQQPYSFPGSFIPGAPIVTTAPVPFSADGLQFSRVGFPGINHTQLPPVTYVRDECWSPRIREVRRSPSPQRRCVSYSSRDSSARIEPESILRQPSLSRQSSARSRHGSTVSLVPDVQDRIPAPRGFKTGTEGLHQEE